MTVHPLVGYCRVIVRLWPLVFATGLLPAAAIAAPAEAHGSVDPARGLEGDLAPKPAPRVDTAEALEAPPPPPRRKGLVLQANLGALFFPGAFGKVSPPAPHFRVALGYEIFRWLMLFGEGELAFGSTHVATDAPFARAFPIWGFGAGARAAIPLGSRVGLWLEAAPGLWTAQTPTNALGVLGFRDAESLGVFVRGRVGVDWYQIDRHFALFVAGGARFAPSFTYTTGTAGAPLVAEGSAGLRYTF